MIPSFGDSGSDVPVETQVLLLEGVEKTGVHDDDAGTPSSEGTLILAKHKGTFSHVEDKKVPPHLDWFGWCTWDVFYTRVDPQGIREGLKRFVYMWHALVGYWGGLHPNHEPLKKYKPKIDCGVDGVKVDIQNVVEALGSGYGGRVMLTKKYQEALEESVLKNFKDNNLICSMSQNTDFFYSSKKSPVARVSEDYMPHVPAIQTSHVAAVAFNSFFQGEIAAVDWDMFQSDHVTADFHAAARALGGCAVYVSDKPGEHDFKILKKLVLPDGSILRARYAGRPTRDCLFNDPVTDGKSLLKIWNMNKFSGVLGVFNCQGAGSWNTKIDVGDFKRDTHQDLPLSALRPVSGHISPLDVESLGNVASETWTGHCANYGENFRFSPIGLLDMYNSGGAVESLKHTDDSSGCSVLIQARGYGRFGAYSSTKPRACFVDMTEAAFTYSPDDGLLTVTLPGSAANTSPVLTMQS
ncbi:UNVERIFIED_CONTAM: putative galactinol--sucrose galactosyltransferase 2 [Sesamum radiatum]|uniref:Galactinol--sucrose galactosyltransferase 2 n=1 Tax=Sesamum radiatum TaxID=300843 RepID=A0AAW2MYF2_SESRA